MRHVTLVLALVFSLALAVPLAGTLEHQDPVLKILEGQASLGPYATPNG